MEYRVFGTPGGVISWYRMDHTASMVGGIVLLVFSGAAPPSGKLVTFRCGAQETRRHRPMPSRRFDLPEAPKGTKQTPPAYEASSDIQCVQRRRRTARIGEGTAHSQARPTSAIRVQVQHRLGAHLLVRSRRVRDIALSERVDAPALCCRRRRRVATWCVRETLSRSWLSVNYLQAIRPLHRKGEEEII